MNQHDMQTESGEDKARVLDPSGGANQVRVRAHNERLILSLVRRHAGLSKAEIARRSGLSAQTTSVIMRQLERDGLLTRGEPVRGKVGQPSVPMKLDPDGVYSFGLKIGRRSADLLLMDFIGRVRGELHQVYNYPHPGQIAEFVRDGVTELAGKLNSAQRSKIAGLGIATPFELWNWAEEIGVDPASMESWRDVDLASVISDIVPFPVFLQNDATAACGAELVFGRGPEFTDFVYFFVGTFIGGGIVLNHSLYSGRSGNAGSFGAMPVAGISFPPGKLIDHASIVVLERMLEEAGKDPSPLWLDPDGWNDLGPSLDEWITQTAKALAIAIVSSCSVIDFQAAIIDGGFPEPVRERLVAEVGRQIEDIDTRGIRLPKICAGSIGTRSRAVGGASLPLFARYLIDENVLFKEA
ncbi:MAG: ROK family transcriptional regulator [Rhizobiaceae bacterium]